MPIIQIDWVEGRTVDQKRELAKKVTAAVCEAGKCPPEAVTIIIRDLPKTDIAKAGVPLADK